MIHFYSSSDSELDGETVFPTLANSSTRKPTSTDRLLGDMEFIRDLAGMQRILPHDEQMHLAKQIFRLRVAFQRLCLQERSVVSHIMTKLYELSEGKGRRRIDGLCEVAMNEVARRKRLRAKVVVNLPTIEKLIEANRKQYRFRRQTAKIIRLIEELEIRNRHFLESPYKNPKARWLLSLYEERCKELVLGNLRLAISVAAKICRKSRAAMPDMIQEGIGGLMHAATKFDYRRGIRFSTYATPWITQAVLATIPNHFRNIRIPLYFDNSVRKLKKTNESTSVKRIDENQWLESQLISSAGVNRIHAQRIVTSDRGTLSLDAEIGKRGSGLTHSTMIADPNVASPVTDAHNSELSDAVEACLSILNPEERMVVTLHFGIGNEGPLSLAAIGREKGLSRERIRLVLRKALKRLKPSLE